MDYKCECGAVLRSGKSYNKSHKATKKHNKRLYGNDVKWITSFYIEVQYDSRKFGKSTIKEDDVNFDKFTDEQIRGEFNKRFNK